LGAAVLFLIACCSSEPRVLRLATTTSTEDAGLLEAILPDFE
jgi:ABC-type tungstate transport system permease subunit